LLFHFLFPSTIENAVEIGIRSFPVLFYIDGEIVFLYLLYAAFFTIQFKVDHFFWEFFNLCCSEVFLLIEIIEVLRYTCYVAVPEFLVVDSLIHVTRFMYKEHHPARDVGIIGRYGKLFCYRGEITGTTNLIFLSRIHEKMLF